MFPSLIRVDYFLLGDRANAQSFLRRGVLLGSDTKLRGNSGKHRNGRGADTTLESISHSRKASLYI